MAYQALIGALALTVGAILRALVSKPEADKQEGTVPEAPKPGDGEARSQRIRQSARGAPRAGLDRRNPDFTRALDLLQAERSSTAGGHVFITGKAGTGKSTLINYFLETTDTRSTVVLAPTGVAALNVRGETVHRFFRFRIDVTPELVRRNPLRPSDPALYRKLSTIIIDEASMLRADLLDCVHEFLRRYGPRPGELFGGVRMVFVGDLYQLPPVVRPEDRAIFNGGHYETPYFFSAFALSRKRPELVELNRVYRQEDVSFVDLLDRVRTDSVNDADIRRLNERVELGRATAIGLTTTRKAADQINGRRLDQLDGEPATFHAEVRNFHKDDYPTEKVLIVKVGARVMLLNNDSGGRWVNGSIADIETVGRNCRWVQVRLQESGELVHVQPFTWESVRFALKNGALTTEMVGAFTQLPLRLAWAVTIHKSQGQTFKNIVVDFGKGAFAAGQAYVALSRSTSLGGIALRRPIDRKWIFTNPRVEDFLAACRLRST